MGPGLSFLVQNPPPRQHTHSALLLRGQCSSSALLGPGVPTAGEAEVCVPLLLGAPAEAQCRGAVVEPMGSGGAQAEVPASLRVQLSSVIQSKGFHKPHGHFREMETEPWV